MKFFLFFTVLLMTISTSLAQSVIVETQDFTSAVTETLTEEATATSSVIISRVSTFKKVYTSDYTTVLCPSPTTVVHKDTTYTATTATRIVITNAADNANSPNNSPSTMRTSVYTPSPSKTQSADAFNPAATETGVVITGAANRASAGFGALFVAGVAAFVL